MGLFSRFVLPRGFAIFVLWSVPSQAACHAAKVAGELLRARLQTGPAVLPTVLPAAAVASTPQYDENGVEILPSFPAWMQQPGQQQQGGGGGGQYNGGQYKGGGGGLWKLLEEAEAEGRQLQGLLRQVRGECGEGGEKDGWRWCSSRGWGVAGWCNCHRRLVRW